jgi:hypothetical protein
VWISRAKSSNSFRDCVCSAVAMVFLPFGDLQAKVELIFYYSSTRVTCRVMNFHVCGNSGTVYEVPNVLWSMEQVQSDARDSRIRVAITSDLFAQFERSGASTDSEVRHTTDRPGRLLNKFFRPLS